MGGTSQDQNMQESFDHFMNYDEDNKKDPKIITLFFTAQSAGSLDLYFKYRHDRIEIDLLTFHEMVNLLQIVHPDRK